MPLPPGVVTPTLGDVTWILGVRSEGKNFLSIPPEASADLDEVVMGLINMTHSSIRGGGKDRIYLKRREVWRGIRGGGKDRIYLKRRETGASIGKGPALAGDIAEHVFPESKESEQAEGPTMEEEGDHEAEETVSGIII
ncbi:hypothetical protein AMTR_s00041p00021370 [Amborella trichopoda]|uniref:Uncharacterized protein n=1 Tax=Amborella trichopoda TaxID=13333 RepID=W1PTD3_AMBTC|nr:hypothetical protein AMTR_s00041p00021370 [Amborella trichopoda]